MAFRARSGYADLCSRCGKMLAALWALKLELHEGWGWQDFFLDATRTGGKYEPSCDAARRERLSEESRDDAGKRFSIAWLRPNLSELDDTGLTP